MDASLNKSTNAQFQDCIKTLLQSNLSDTQKKTFLTTLKKILVNVTKYPSNKKFQSINTESETFILKITLNGALNDTLVEKIFASCYFIKSESLNDSQKRTSSQSCLCSPKTFVLSSDIYINRLYSLQTILQKALDEISQPTQIKQCSTNVFHHQENVVNSKVADSLVLKSIREDQKERLPNKDNISRCHYEKRKSVNAQNSYSNNNNSCRSFFQRITKLFCFKKKN